MVINRAIRSFTQHKTFQLPKYSGNPINYIIADSNGRRRPRTKRNTNYRKTYAPSHPLKRHEVTGDITGLTTTPQTIPLNDIAQGSSTQSERTEQRIRAHSVEYKSTLLWQAVPGNDNQAQTVRFVLLTHTPAFNPASSPFLSTFANIYDKRDYPEIGHIYKDFRVVRKESTTLATMISIKQNLRGLTMKYDGDVATDQQLNKFSQLSLVIVADVDSTSKASMNQSRSVLRYHG